MVAGGDADDRSAQGRGRLVPGVPGTVVEAEAAVAVERDGDVDRAGRAGPDPFEGDRTGRGRDEDAQAGALGVEGSPEWRDPRGGRHVGEARRIVAAGVGTGELQVALR